MPQVEKLSIFLASPSDVSLERRYVEEVITELNHTVAPGKDLILSLVKWETHAYPGYGKDAQALINEQIAEMSQFALFVGLMWNRIGTPTPRPKSGTVEEFNLAKAALSKFGQPEIWFYFRNPASTQINLEQPDQRQQVDIFKQEFEATGMSFSYSKATKFKEMFRSQMTLWLNKRKRQINNITSTTLTDEMVSATMNILLAVQYAERNSISQKDYDVAFQKWEVDKERISNQLRNNSSWEHVCPEWDELAKAVTTVYALSGTYDKKYRAQALEKIVTYLNYTKASSQILLNFEYKTSKGERFHKYFKAWGSVRDGLIDRMKKITKKLSINSSHIV